MSSRRSTSWLALLLSTLLVLFASAQSVHEQLAPQQPCEDCITAFNPDDLLPPLLIALPALIIDLSPSVLLTFAVPRHLAAGLSDREPLRMMSLNNTDT